MIDLTKNAQAKPKTPRLNITALADNAQVAGCIPATRESDGSPGRSIRRAGKTIRIGTPKKSSLIHQAEAAPDGLNTACPRIFR